MNTLVTTTNDLTVLQTIAKTAHASGLYNGVGGAEKILMILLSAHDLGIKPTIALNGGIWNIQGKVEISARLMTSMIRRAGHSISITECSDKICTLKGKRADNGDEIVSSFSWDDASKAGLANRDNWKKYSQDMLYARAMSRLARRLFPDVIGTAYVEGEIRDAEVVDITPEVSRNANLSQLEKSDEGKYTSPYISDAEAGCLESLLSQCSSDYQEKFNAGLKKLKITMRQIAPENFEKTVTKLKEKAQENADNQS